MQDAVPQTRLTGNRIRERRLLQGMRQAELAKAVGVSPSYLNLIEHNRRRIGGKLLNDIAGVLNVEPSLLAEGAEAELIGRLRRAAGEAGEEGAETTQAEEFAGRFPGWARLVAAQRKQVAGLERAVETLTDRLTHDPHLAATLHEVLDTATAIRSTASILVETREIEPEWRDRFHRNINEDAERLADGARSLAGYLDGAGDAGREQSSPQEEVEAYMRGQDWHMAALEDPDGATPQEIVGAAHGLVSVSARAQTLDWLTRYEADARAMPLELMQEAVEAHGPDPLAIAGRFEVDLAAAMRRIASLPGQEAGLVICDGSGTITYRRPVGGFALPRFGAACPLWPLFRALSRPMVPLFERLSQAGRAQEHSFVAYAIALPKGQPGLNREPRYEAHMLILPEEGGKAPEAGHFAAVSPVGATCRICVVADCDARREPSILAGAE
ncbi:helix-turn-helix domain-containing protein [Alisedimentitalea sp. MJ-SS2]|uniref:helix-turn-helix domain-containing protein n=1 Tax=Aliisedimentitalea sp. MJ-SS2 TaxID=3049795 RepID=UPI0029136E7E|nr:helix-turn-helix domain-containing protein [Alisedimentitalea sp. MJ-SS2]MDU8929098.1 helix-turn-helix domain-containing protein [Alisedimentitalea sp. MJ-SS2]